MIRTLYFIFLSALFSQVLHAQDKWDLKKCVEYAMANNISIKQTEIQSGISEIQLSQSKKAQLPSLNLSTGSAYSNGRNQDPTNFSLITQGFLSANMQLQSSVQIFNWFSQRNTILANDWQLQANKANTEKLKNDIALIVANAYLQILLSKEQEKIANVQLEQSIAQLDNTRKLVNAGALPELNAAELEAQVARDSSNLINAQGIYQQSVLSLKSNMNMDAATQLDLITPPIEYIPIEDIASLQPEIVYASAIVNLPQQRVNDFNLKAAQKNEAAAKASRYPNLTAFGSLSSTFNSRGKEIVGVQNFYPAIGKVNVGGVDYAVYPSQPFSDYTFGKTAFFKQTEQNFRQSVGISLNIPILNGGTLQAAWKRSKLNIKSAELQKQSENLKIKQDIYQAYNAAMVAMQKFNASKKSVETAERTFGYSQKRFDIGMLTTLELITNQNNLFRAKLEMTLNQFDFVFKMKVLEFYKGQGLKL